MVVYVDEVFIDLGANTTPRRTQFPATIDSDAALSGIAERRLPVPTDASDLR